MSTMKTPSDKPKEYRITLGYAAATAATTLKKMAECLHELGVPIDAEGAFSLGMMFCAVRVNCDPYRSRLALRRSMKQAVTKAFGKPVRRKVAA